MRENGFLRGDRFAGLELSLVQLRSLSHTPGGTSIENRRSTYTRHLADLPFVTWHIKYQSLIDKRWLLWQEVVRHPTQLMAVSCPWRTLGTQSRTQRSVKLTAGSSVHSLAVLRKRCVLPFVSLCRLALREREREREGGDGRGRYKVKERWGECWAWRASVWHRAWGGTIWNYRFVLTLPDWSWKVALGPAAMAWHYCLSMCVLCECRCSLPMWRKRW